MLCLILSKILRRRVIATLFGGTVAADKIYISVRRAALEKSAKGLPNLVPFAKQLTKKDRDI